MCVAAAAVIVESQPHTVTAFPYLKQQLLFLLTRWRHWCSRFVLGLGVLMVTNCEVTARVFGYRVRWYHLCVQLLLFERISRASEFGGRERRAKRWSEAANEVPLYAHKNGHYSAVTQFLRVWNDYYCSFACVHACLLQGHCSTLCCHTGIRIEECAR